MILIAAFRCVRSLRIEARALQRKTLERLSHLRQD